MTWTAGGAKVTSMCDGNWLGGSTSYHNRLYQVLGEPDDFERQDITGYPAFVWGQRSWFGYGIISIDGTIYSVISKTPLTGWSGPFRGVKVLASSDDGKSWSRVDRFGRLRSMAPDDPDWNTVDETEMFFFEEQGIRRAEQGGAQAAREPAVQARKTHVAYTRSVDGRARFYVDGKEAAAAQVEGDFSTWDPAFHFGLANESTDDRPWLGEYHLVAVYSRALEPDQITEHLAAQQPVHTGGLQALYTFEEGAGRVVHDRSGKAPALDLRIGGADEVEWTEDGLRVARPASIVCDNPAARLVDAVREAGAFSVEAWITPADTVQAGPARIVTMSAGHWTRNFTLGQSGNAYEMRLRTSETTAQGEPSLQTPRVYEAYPFSFVEFVQHGQDHALAPDGYVYIYAPEGARAHQLMLARAPKEKLWVRDGWEYFVRYEADGIPVFSSDIQERGPVHTYPDRSADGNHFGWYSWLPSVVWNEGLGLYIKVNGGTYGGQNMTDSDEDYYDAWMHTETGSLGFWYAENPYGPWKAFFYTDYWTVDDPGNRTYQPKLSPKWISADGREMVLVWSDAMRNAEGRSHTVNYTWNQMKITVETE